MKSNITVAAKMFGMGVFACLISFFVYFSLFIIMRSIATDVTGYTIYQINEDGSKTDVEIVEKVPESVKENQGYYENRSAMPKSASITLGVLQVFCGVGIFFSTVGSVLSTAAARDRNDADFNDAPTDKLRGLKIGFFAALPLFVYNLIIIALRFLFSSSSSWDWLFWVYRWVALSPVKPIVDLMTGNAKTLAETPAWSVIALIIFSILVILFSFAMYLICYNEDNVISKLLYKSTRKKEQTKRLGGK